ncbi:hypothetical protein [Ornithinimicrobium tianjinense]|uniref:Uncharacterized protein n=1 Tax=Ornithinimicrobium tianjinense TaxID=1195761 RepID=A0A917BX95_9MICO|nr:hypothetical protein [Ornithinimicrobium tianjinense]GGF60147.1 hypothetical protein GCM10011366_29980 [Ornithinimicrobium tianjinense]
MSDPAPRPTQRVRVTASRSAARPARRRRTRVALVEQTGVGELYLQGLLRAQLRLALTVLGAVATVLLGLPVVLALVPAARQVHVGPLPLTWLGLGVLVYPAAVAAAWLYRRSAERHERRFAEFVAGEQPPGEGYARGHDPRDPAR